MKLLPTWRVSFARSHWLLVVVIAALALLRTEARAEDLPPGLVPTAPPSGRSVQTAAGIMVPYSATIPGTEIRFEMQPVPGGKFRLGSPAGEAKRSSDEGPQVEIEIEPFWIGTYEVTWAEYKTYMSLNDAFRKIAAANLKPITPTNSALVVTAPSKLYDSGFTFQLGEAPRQPAVTMSQFAARQYTKWLSGLTTQFYRLPSEAEWEYACRAGTTTPYSFGDDPKQLDEYAWHFGNSNELTHPVGQKKPNPWGLFDMHGNVSEWTLDEYAPEHYQQLGAGPHPVAKSILWPTKIFPRVVRGGCWDDDADRLRSAARRGSHDDDWRAEDPNIPKSPWWFTSQPALGVGFRLVRPLVVPAKGLHARYWDADVESIQRDADRRIDHDGRGARGIADPELPELLRKVR